MMLSANTLKFYDPTNGTTEQAVLDTTGLKLKKGGLEAGTKNSTDYIYVWSNNDNNHNININNSGNKTDWRIVAGNKFGVDKAGNLYSSNAIINGVLTATGGKIGGWSIGTDTNKSLYYGNQVPGATTSNLVLSPISATNTNAIAGSETGKTWFIAAGQKFGVDTNGNLYATGAKISGEVNITAGNVYTKDESNNRFENNLYIDTTYSGSNIIFTAKVILKGVDVTSQYFDGDFEWFYRTPTGDVPLNLNGKSITIPQSSQEYGRTIVCVFSRNQYINLLTHNGNKLKTNTDNYLLGRSEY